jgi:hypothetical protein
VQVGHLTNCSGQRRIVPLTIGHALSAVLPVGVLDRRRGACSGAVSGLVLLHAAGSLRSPSAPSAGVPAPVCRTMYCTQTSGPGPASRIASSARLRRPRGYLAGAVSQPASSSLVGPGRIPLTTYGAGPSRGSGPFKLGRPPDRPWVARACTSRLSGHCGPSASQWPSPCGRRGHWRAY